MFSDFSIISLVIAALFGALVNNVFTLKVKSKVEAADDLYDRLWQLDNLRSEFVAVKTREKKLKDVLFSHINNKVVLVNNLYNKKIDLAHNEKIKYIQEELKQDNKKIDEKIGDIERKIEKNQESFGEILEKFNLLKSEICTLSLVITDKKDVSQDLVDYYNEIGKIANGKVDAEDYRAKNSESETFKRYNALHAMVRDEIIRHRKELTSMPYLLTQIGYELRNTIGWIIFSKLTFIGIILFLHQ